MGAVIGQGDLIMTTGSVRQFDGRVRIVGKNGAYWSPMWRGHPSIAQLGEDGDYTLMDGPGCRPYVDYQRTTKQRWAYTDWRCTPGHLPWVKPDPRGTGRIFIEPHIKQNASCNKQWGKWQDLARLGEFAQMGPPGTKFLDGVEQIITTSFEEAVQVLSAAKAAVLPEGGLHHAAAATGVPAVVLFGAMTSPANTGYDEHENIWIDDPGALGWRIPNQRCKQAWDQITLELVMFRLERLLFVEYGSGRATAI